MITNYLKTPPFSFVQVIVVFQLVVTVILSGFVLFLLVYRNHRKERMASLGRAYAEALVGEILAFLEEGDAKPVIVSPASLQWGMRDVLKTVFFDHLKSFNGPEKKYIVRRYRDLGFVKEDVLHTKSFFWWRRLRAVSNLGLLNHVAFAPLLREMSKDRNELVVASACLSLSALEHPLNSPCPLSELPTGVVQRKNVMHQILKNWSQLYGQDFLVQQIRADMDPEMLTVLVSALASLRSPEIAEAYAGILSATSTIPSQALEQMLALIRNVGDPSWARVVYPYLENSDEKIRLRAFQYLIEIGEMDSRHVSTQLIGSSSLLRLWLKNFEEGKAA